MRHTARLIPWCIALFAGCLIGTASASEPTSFAEGVSYVSVSPAQPTNVKPGQIEVIEFFWYGCPHCYALEPYLETWLKHKPANVMLIRIPVAMDWGEHMDVDGRAYYTARILRLEPKIHTPLFDAIHRDRQFNLVSDETALQSFFATYGVNKRDFDATWNSFAVQLKMNQALDTEQRYNLESVPTLVIDGRWKTGAQYKNGDDHYLTPSEIMQCVDMLVQKAEKGPAH